MTRRQSPITKWFRLSAIALMTRLQRHGWFTGDSWAAWRVVVKAMFALPLDEPEAALFSQLSGGRRPPAKQVRESWFVVGRRGGKSLITAFLGFLFATCGLYRFARGEKGVVMLLAADRRQARVIFRYLQAFFAVAPFDDLVEKQLQEAIHLKNGLIIEIHTASFRSVRGYTIVCCIGDEAAFWSSDGANPDEEIFNAIRPAMASVPQAMLIVLSSPYAKRGQLWETFKRYFGQDSDDVLVIQGASRLMNPSLPESVVVKAYEADPASASAEYGAEFRSDIESFVRREAVEACVIPGRYELPPVPNIMYDAGLDPAGGSGLDSYTLTISHIEKRNDRAFAVLDLVAEVKPPFSPEQASADIGKILTRYGITKGLGDKWGGDWPREPLRKAGISYETVDRAKSDLYKELLPAINSGAVELLDHPVLITQLCGLERRTSRGGRDTIDHQPNGHDDIANSAAIALLESLKRGQRSLKLEDFFGEHCDKPDPDALEERGKRGDAAILEACRKTGFWFPA